MALARRSAIGASALLISGALAYLLTKPSGGFSEHGTTGALPASSDTAHSDTPSLAAGGLAGRPGAIAPPGGGARSTDVRVRLRRRTAPVGSGVSVFLEARQRMAWNVRASAVTDASGEAVLERLETGSHLSGAEWSVRPGVLATEEIRFPLEGEPKQGDVIDVLLPDVPDLTIVLQREGGEALEIPVQVAIQLPDGREGRPCACVFVLRGGGGAIPWSGAAVQARLRAVSLDGQWQTVADTRLDLGASVGSAENVLLVLRQQPAVRLRLAGRAGRKLRLLYSRGLSEPPLVTVAEAVVEPDGAVIARFPGLDQPLPRRRITVEVLGAADHAEETAEIDLAGRFPTGGVLDVGIVEVHAHATIATVEVEFDGGSRPSREPAFYVAPSGQTDPVAVAAKYDPARSEYTLSGIVHGTFSLTVTHSEYLNQRIEGLSPGAHVRVRLVHGGVIEGSVIADSATAATELHLRVETDERAFRDVEVAPGAFRLDGLPPGSRVRLTLLTRRTEFAIAEVADLPSQRTGVVLDARGKLRHVRARLVPSDGAQVPSSIRMTAPKGATLPARDGFVDLYVPVDTSAVTLSAEGYAPAEVRLDADAVDVRLSRN